MAGRLYYNTNGFAHHRLEDVVEILADLGYAGISLTPDVHHLDPLRATAREVQAFRAHCERRGLAIALEGGARYVLDPRRKHHPTLLTTAGHERRQAFDRRLVDLAAELGSPLVSIWSGAREADTPPRDAALDLLAERLKPELEHAAARGVTIAFEPEPGMLVETLADYAALSARLPGRAPALTLDTGHLAAREEPPFDDCVRRSAGALANVQLDDSPRGVHEHRFFGEGDLDLRAIARALTEVGYTGPLSVELSRHGHDAPAVAARSIRVLRELGF